MTGAFALNALFAGSLIYGAAAILTRLIRGRAGYLFALAAFLLAIAAPLGMTRTNEGFPATGPRLGPEISVDAQMPVFTGVWIVGTVLLLLRELRGHVRLARVRGRRLTTEEKTWLGWPVDDDRIGLVDGPPRTLASRVLVSRELLKRTPRAMAAAVVRHERAHLRWRDPIVGSAVRLILALFWIAPALWLLERLIRREREVAADRVALRGSSPEDAAGYAEALLTFARGASSGTAVGFASELAHRVGRLFPASTSPRGTLASLGAALAAVTALAFVPTVRFDRSNAWPLSFAPKPLLPVAEAGQPEPPAILPAGPQAKPRRVRQAGDWRALPTGSGFAEFAARVGEPARPTAEEVAPAPAAIALETAAVTPPAVHRHIDRDVHVDVRRHVIRIRD